MPTSHSNRIVSRIALLASSVLLLVLISWVGYRVFQPVAIPIDFSNRKPVSFHADENIAKNKLLQRLQTFGIRTTYLVGDVGNPYPLGGDPKKLGVPEEYDDKAVLVTATKIQGLEGVIERIAVNQSESCVLVLSSEEIGGDRIRYIIKSISPDRDEVVSEWEIQSRPDLRVADLASDSMGRIWLLNERGQLGLVHSGTNPTWFSTLSTGLPAKDLSRLDIEVDTLDRIWVTDGAVVSMGDETAMAPIDLSLIPSENQRIRYDELLEDGALSAGLQPSVDSEELFKSAIAPMAFFPLADGRMGLTMSAAAVIFPASQTGKALWIPTLQYSLTPYGISSSGDLWGFRYTDRVLSRIREGKELSFDTVPAPSGEIGTIPVEQFSFSEKGVYVYEYMKKVPHLWFTEGETWSLKMVVMKEGSDEIRTMNQMVVDPNGIAWILTDSGILYQLKSGAETDTSLNAFTL